MRCPAETVAAQARGEALRVREQLPASDGQRRVTLEVNSKIISTTPEANRRQRHCQRCERASRRPRTTTGAVAGVAASQQERGRSSSQIVPAPDSNEICEQRTRHRQAAACFCYAQEFEPPAWRRGAVRNLVDTEMSRSPPKPHAGDVIVVGGRFCADPALGYPPAGNQCVKHGITGTAPAAEVPSPGASALEEQPE